MKDRIGSQILTHYPETLEIAKTITQQEAKFSEDVSIAINVPALAKDILEQIVFEARMSEYIDTKSGVSARMSITMYENLMATAERRALLSGDDKTSIRLSDFMRLIPAITGKVELVYEGAQEGAAQVTHFLIGDAIHTLLSGYFPKIEKIERENEKNAYSDLLEWFFAETGFELLDEASDSEYQFILDSVKPLDILIKKYQPAMDKKDIYFMKKIYTLGDG